MWFVHPEMLLSTLMVLLLPFAFCFFLLSFHQFSLICIFQFGRAARVTGMTRLTQIPVHESEGRTYAPKTKNFMVARRITSRTTFAQCAKAYEEAGIIRANWTLQAGSTCGDQPTESAWSYCLWLPYWYQYICLSM